MQTSLLCVAILLGAASGATWTDTFTVSTNDYCSGNVGTAVQTVDSGDAASSVDIEQLFTFGSTSALKSYAGTTEAATMAVTLSCDSSGPTDEIHMHLESCSPFNSLQCIDLYGMTFKFTLDGWDSLSLGGICVPVEAHSAIGLSGTFYLEGTDGEMGYTNPCSEKSAGSASSLAVLAAAIAAAVL